jgi:murein DD-endopeptidase MepM/ murein hydrolase activator NlpD
MADYLAPAAPVSASWASHKNRTPPSSEPGTDYATAYGTKVAAPGNGSVIEIKTTNSGGMGRFVAIKLDDGRTTRTIHMSRVDVKIGARVKRGQVIGLSGASGNGSDWYYGPHVHQTLWPGAYWANPTIDFELYTGTPTTPTAEEESEVDEMYRAKSTKSGTWYVIGEFSVTQIESGPNGSANWNRAVAYNDMSGKSFPDVSSDRIKSALSDVDLRITDFLSRLGNTDAANASHARIQTMIEAES